MAIDTKKIVTAALPRPDRILRPAIQQDGFLILLVTVYLVAIRALFILYKLPFPNLYNFLTSGILYICSIVLILGIGYLVALFKKRPDSPIQFGMKLFRDYQLRERLGLAAPALIATAIFLPAFSAAKSAIPYVNPFHLDPLFIRMDIAIHGDHAWKVVQKFVGYPFLTFLIAGCYHIWILFLYAGVPLIAGFVERSDLRRQFLVTYTLCWIVIGTILAMVLSSAGPCFVEYFYGHHTFRPLMDYLHHVDDQFPIAALDVQQELLRWREHEEYGLGRGITAMPSMHVSVATLFAILGFQLSRRLGLILSAFALLIMIGSVHLGYHYAVDGYVSAVLTACLWFIVRKFSVPHVGSQLNQ